MSLEDMMVWNKSAACSFIYLQQKCTLSRDIHDCSVSRI